MGDFLECKLFFFLVCFGSPPAPPTPQQWCNISTPPHLVFVPSAFGAVAPCSDVMEQGEEHSGEIQPPEDSANALPQFLNVIMS